MRLRRLAAAMALGAVAGFVVSCAACESLVGAEAAIRSTLLRMEKNGFAVPVPGGTSIAIRQARFREAQVFEVRGGYYVNSFVDAEGFCGDTTVSYLGTENIPFGRQAGSWQPASPVLGNLAGIVAVLAQEHLAPAATAKWAIRVDRTVAQVYEEVRATTDGGAPDTAGRNLSLVLEQGHWRVKNGADIPHLK